MGFFKLGRTESGAARPAPGDKSGFAEEALPQMDSVYRFALRLCQGSQNEADDLLQETMLRAFQSWHTYQPGTECRSWLFTICRNEFLKKASRRKRKAEVLTSEIDADMESMAAMSVFSGSSEVDPEHDFYASFVDKEVMAAVDRLPDVFREALVLSDLEGMNYPQISEVLGIPAGTVKSRIFRGRRILQESLYEYAVEMGYVRPKEKA
jgi:RNA polymerase sigma-70 factor (ECF subfamily)